MQDWRASVKNYNSIYEMDPIDVLIVLRHEYLESIKSLCHSTNPNDKKAIDYSFEVIDSLEKSIECHFSNYQEMLVSLEPASIKK